MAQQQHDREQPDALSSRTARTARRLWGLVLLRGAAYLVVGVLLFARPDDGLTWLVWLLAAVVAVQGVLLLVEGWRLRADAGPGGPGGARAAGGGAWRVAVGVLSVAAAVLLVVWPSMTGAVLVRVLGVWAVLAGVLGVVGALRARAAGGARWDWQLLDALLWLVLGALLLVRPFATVHEAAVLLGLYLVMAGVVLLVGAWSARSAAPVPGR